MKGNGRTLHVHPLLLPKRRAQVLDLCRQSALHVLGGARLGLDLLWGKGVSGKTDFLDEGLALAKIAGDFSRECVNLPFFLRAV